MPNIGEILEVTDFSGGKTDYPLESAPNMYEEADNFVVDITGKLLVRPGMNNLMLGTSNAPFSGESSGNRNILKMKSFLDMFVAINKNKIGYISRNELPTQSAPISNTGFSQPNQATYDSDASDDADITNFHAADKFPWADTWNGQFYYGGANASGTPIYPLRLVKMDAPVIGIRVVGAGLPTPYRYDASPTRFVSNAPGTTNYYVYYLVLRYEYSLYTIEGVSTPVDFVDLSAPYFPYDITGNASIRVGTTGDIGVAGNTTTIDRLFSTFVSIAGLSRPGSDTNRWSLDIYRTKKNEQTAYLVTTIANIGTTITTNAYAYVDSMLDATLEAKLPFYMNGGIVANGEPPCSRFGVIANNIGWYGYTQDAFYDPDTGGRGLDTIRTNRVRHSIVGDPDSCPSDFFVDVEGEITGMGQIEGIPIVFTRDRIFRLEGARDIFGGGDVVPKVIAENVGTMFPYSIINTPNNNGLYFAGLDGFYFTDGNKVIQISKTLKLTYGAVNAEELSNSVMGAYDRVNNRVLWHFNLSTMNYRTFAFHEDFGINANGVFTTWSYLQPDQSTQNFNISAIAFETTKKLLIFAGDNTQLLFMNTNTRQQAVVDKYIYSPTTASIDSYNYIDIIVDYKSVIFNFGTNKLRKWVPIIELVADRTVSYLVDLAVGVQISFDNDRKQSFSNLKVISWAFSNPGLINVWRRFLKTKLRCLTKQVRFQNGKIVLQKSDDASTATISAASSISVDGISWSNSRSVLLDNTSFNWFTDAEEKVIAFDTDGYVNEYRILNLDSGSDTIIIRDPSLTAVAGAGKKWEIRGYTTFPKLKSYALNYEVLGDTTKQYSVTKSSGNA